MKTPGQLTFELHEMLVNWSNVIDRYPRLPPDETERLIHIWVTYRDTKEGSPSEALNARNLLVLHNMRLVVSIARTIYSNHLEMRELISEGVLGFIQSLETFKMGRGTRLGTYATLNIKRYMIRAVQSKDTAIRFPVHRYDDLTKLRKRLRGTPAQHDYLSIKVDTLKSMTGMETPRIRGALEAAKTSYTSLDATQVWSRDDGSNIPLVDTLKADDEPPTYDYSLMVVRMYEAASFDPYNPPTARHMVRELINDPNVQMKTLAATIGVHPTTARHMRKRIAHYLQTHYGY